MEFRVDIARTEGHDPDPRAGILGRQRLGETDQVGLNRAVEGAPGQPWDQSRQGCHIQDAALATHKVASVSLGIGASLRHARESSLNARLSALILLSGLPGVWLGARTVLALPAQLSTLLLGLLTIALGAYSAYRPQLGASARERPWTLRRALLGAVVLWAIGFLNGSLTSGTGLFVTLWLVRWFGLDYGKAVAHTLILVGLFWNGTGALTLGFQGQIAWSWLPMLLLGSMAGGYLGAHLALRQGSQLVKRAFEVLCLLMGVSLLVKALVA